MSASNNERVKGSLYPSEENPTHKPVMDAVMAEEPGPGVCGERVHPPLGMGVCDTTPCAG